MKPYKSLSIVFFIVCFQCVLTEQAGAERCEMGGIEGQCVPLPECPQVLALLKNSSTTAKGLETSVERRCGFDSLNIKVCCPNPVENIKSPALTGIIENDENDVFSLYVSGFPDHETCGWTDPARPNIRIKHLTKQELASGEMQVIGNGIPVISRDMARYMAVLGYKLDVNVQWECGGSIITEKHILTAAHCIRKSLYVVRVGELDILGDENDAQPVDFLIKKKIPHEQYTQFHNDIAIVVLDGTIDFKNDVHLGPICLPLDSKEKKLTRWGPYSGNRAGIFVAGWGEDPEKERRPSFLSWAPVKIFEEQKCKNIYGDQNRTIDERVFCAGNKWGEHDACNGDSGGPLVAEYELPELNRTFFYQLGIISYGYRCSARYYAGVYTNVTSFLPWIQQKVLLNWN